MNGVCPKSKGIPHVTSQSPFCAVGASVRFSPAPLLRVPYYVAGLLYHSLFRKSPKKERVCLFRHTLSGSEAFFAYRSIVLMVFPFDSLMTLTPFAGAERRLPFKP